MIELLIFILGIILGFLAAWFVRKYKYENNNDVSKVDYDQVLSQLDQLKTDNARADERYQLSDGQSERLRRELDDERNKTKIKPFVNGKNWEYDIYLDPNSDLKRALNINTIPFSFLVNGKGEIVWQHNGYSAGDEEHLLELIKKVAAGEEIK